MPSLILALTFVTVMIGRHEEYSENDSQSWLEFAVKATVKSLIGSQDSVVNHCVKIP